MPVEIRVMNKSMLFAEHAAQQIMNQLGGLISFHEKLLVCMCD